MRPTFKSMMRFACIFLLPGVFAVPAFAQETTVDGFLARTYRSASGKTIALLKYASEELHSQPQSERG